MKLYNALLLCYVYRTRLVNADFKSLSQKIQNLFPNEQQAFYYVPPKSEGPCQKISKGKLPDFYRNKLDECRQIGLIERKRKRSVDPVTNDSDSESSVSPTSRKIENLFFNDGFLIHFIDFYLTIKDFEICYKTL